ncbi:MAG TPA: hypothetical protein VH189_02410 [Rhizomicrobium sp.]|jgi:hypothetical protein|nr:hypothetical protein [Rhizomicrobium sp.]
MRVWLLAAAILVLAVPAQARPRDDALSGAFRCAAIADSRAWLDCYYGAAQPVRASLGMPPALAGQLKLAASPPGGGEPQNEAVRDEVMSAAAGCIRVAGERPWLDCYYGAAQPMRVQLGLASPQTLPRPAPVPTPQLAYAAPAPRPAGPAPMPRSTGLLTGLFNDSKPVVRNMPMRSFSQDKNGSFTVTLADGQVWKQVAEDEVYHPAHWRKEAGEMLVTISPAPMHTFSMKVEGESHDYKVRRIH